MKCPAPSSQDDPESDILISSEDKWMQLNCGGYFAMNIFETGVLQGILSYFGIHIFLKIKLFCNILFYGIFTSRFKWKTAYPRP